MSRVSVNAEDEALYVGKGKRKRFPFKCYNCGIHGHMAHNCPSEPKEDDKTTTTQEEEKPWDVEACFAIDENAMALIATVENKGHYVVFGPNDVKIYKDFQTPSKVVLQSRRNDYIYVLSAESAYVEKTKTNQNVDLWHMRLSHVSYDKLELMKKKKLVSRLPVLKVNKELVCARCQFEKAHQLPFMKSNFHAKAPLELVHSDVFGPVKQSSIKGMKYIITFIDDYSRYI
uniref:CCHC-type domain-containing protein n=1 Tax=Lactuca sativa TaxID=4236 RepID=A0A9R1XJJ3_LACSA|nr:hypothetical protein LSAT_V11C400212760 [Lactuca sativa]